MAKGFPHPMNNRIDPDYLEGRWGILCALYDAWKDVTLPSTLQGALKPFLSFTGRYRNGGILLRHRLYILFTGRLPGDL